MTEDLTYEQDEELSEPYNATIIRKLSDGLALVTKQLTRQETAELIQVSFEVYEEQLTKLRDGAEKLALAVLCYGGASAAIGLAEKSRLMVAKLQELKAGGAVGFVAEWYRPTEVTIRTAKFYVSEYRYLKMHKKQLVEYRVKEPFGLAGFVLALEARLHEIGERLPKGISTGPEAKPYAKRSYKVDRHVE